MADPSNPGDLKTVTANPDPSDTNPAVQPTMQPAVPPAAG